MKRLLCVVLVLCLALPWGGVFAEEEGEKGWVPIENLLWGIPLGIGLEECVVLVTKLVGVELEVTEILEGQLFSFHSPNKEQRMNGYLAKLLLDFGDDGKLRLKMAERYGFTFEKDWEDFSMKFLYFTLEMIEKARNDHGVALGGFARIDSSQRYSMPVVDGVPDDNTLRDIFAVGFRSFSVTYFYDDVSIGVQAYRSSEGIDFLAAVSIASLESMHHMLNESEDVRVFFEKKKEGAN